jgi:hypothetical protein
MKIFIATTFLSLFFIGLVNSQEDYEFEFLNINSVSAPIYAGGPFYVDPINTTAEVCERAVKRGLLPSRSRAKARSAW